MFGWEKSCFGSYELIWKNWQGLPLFSIYVTKINELQRLRRE